jgi:hypothetical protein
MSHAECASLAGGPPNLWRSQPSEGYSILDAAGRVTLVEADVPPDNEVAVCRTGNPMSVKKSKATSRSIPTDAQQQSSVNMEPGRRLWLTIIDPTAKEPEKLWVEVFSSDEDSIVVKLVSPDTLMEPTFRQSGMNADAFQMIKLRAEYARDTIGGAQASPPGDIH